MAVFRALGGLLVGIIQVIMGIFAVLLVGTFLFGGGCSTRDPAEDGTPTSIITWDK